MTFEIKQLATLHSDFPEKFGIPRQSGLVDSLDAYVVFEQEFRNPQALRGLESYSHLWLIWQFSDVLGKTRFPCVRPPRLGGNTRVGVFATRSPFRPNSLGLSCVRLEGIENTKNYGTVLHVRGADIMDGTPIFDIKPYLTNTDSRPDAICGFADRYFDYSLKVEYSDGLLESVPDNLRKSLDGILSEDPRPAYQSDPNRIYTLLFAGLEVSFRVSNSTVTVTDIVKKNNTKFF